MRLDYELEALYSLDCSGMQADLYSITLHADLGGKPFASVLCSDWHRSRQVRHRQCYDDWPSGAHACVCFKCVFCVPTAEKLQRHAN